MDQYMDKELWSFGGKSGDHNQEGMVLYLEMEGTSLLPCQRCEVLIDYFVISLFQKGYKNVFVFMCLKESREKFEAWD